MCQIFGDISFNILILWLFDCGLDKFLVMLDNLESLREK